MKAISRPRDGRQGIAKLVSLPGDAVVALTGPESHALVVTFSRDGEEPEEILLLMANALGGMPLP